MWNQKSYQLYKKALQKRNNKLANKINNITNDMRDTMLKEHINQVKNDFIERNKISKTKLIKQYRVIEKTKSEKKFSKRIAIRQTSTLSLLNHHKNTYFTVIPSEDKLIEMILAAASVS